MREGYCRMCESTVAGPTGLCQKCQRDYDNFYHPNPCIKCNGTGEENDGFFYAGECRRCKGTGEDPWPRVK